MARTEKVAECLVDYNKWYMKYSHMSLKVPWVAGCGILVRVHFSMYDCGFIYSSTPKHLIFYYYPNFVSSNFHTMQAFYGMVVVCKHAIDDQKDAELVEANWRTYILSRTIFVTKYALVYVANVSCDRLCDVLIDLFCLDN